ncbi:MAG: peptide chain release factor N(5)-glutamine methyltransferase [Bacteroidia bacterium]|nr:peptide chain release factor N(5)-glutamine methyltransferase [Bacteroidia bacterium]
MRIASNKLSDLIDFFYSELSSVYSPEEIKLLTQYACKHYLNYSPSDILTGKNENINQSDVIKLYDCVLALKQNRPIQYILGETEFYHLKFKVNPHVLIPRPETEELVELIIKDCKKAGFEDPDILDIGTGSGCIPIALKKNLEDANVSAVDVSQEALITAQQNAILNNVTIMFNKVNILTEEADYSLENYDIIVSNPPYIAKKEADSMHARVKDFEPQIALFVDNEDALLFYRRIITLCKKHLNAGGNLYFELNPIYAQEIKQLAIGCGEFKSVNLLKDLSGNIRFLKAERND